jgi:FeS assembly SUF system regulator
VASEAHLPPPTVSKLLRLLAKEGLLASHRGVKGGYGLARPAEDITVGSIIKALEGPIAITTCTNDTPGECEHESLCPVRGHWHLINLAIRQALDSITLADMAAHPHRLRFPAIGAVRPQPLPCAPGATRDIG